MDVILRVCKARKVSAYTTYCTVLTAWAESRLRSNARSAEPVSASGYYSEGVFQQTLPWWKNNHWDVEASCNAFLDNFRANNMDPVRDCWDVQRWNAPDYRRDLNGFLASAETKNYLDCAADIEEMVNTRKVPR